MGSNAYLRLTALGPVRAEGSRASLEFGGFGRWIAPNVGFLRFSRDAGRVGPFQGAWKAQRTCEQARRRPETAELEASLGRVTDARRRRTGSPRPGAPRPPRADGAGSHG